MSNYETTSDTNPMDPFLQASIMTAGWVSLRGFHSTKIDFTINGIGTGILAQVMQATMGLTNWTWHGKP